MPQTPKLESVSYQDGDVVLTGWLARPVGTPRGAVLIWPTIANVGPAIEARATALAEQGYIALIGDFYGAPVASFEASFPMAAELRGDWEQYRARLRAALTALRTVPGVDGLKIAVIGYCMGGQAALELARDGADIAAAVSFHGVFATEKPAQPGAVKARILVLHGDADPLAPRDAVIGLWQELDTAGANWHFHAYANVRHGFTDPESDARGKDFLGYNTSADRQSWAAMLSFFDEIFA